MREQYHAEIIGLAALVNQETELMRAENEDRHRQGFASAYTFEVSGFGKWATQLERRFREIHDEEKEE
jgi:hypothetical protein